MLDSDNEDDEEINTKGKAFLLKKNGFKTPVHFFAVVKVYLNKKRHQSLLHIGDFDVWFMIMR